MHENSQRMGIQLTDVSYVRRRVQKTIAIYFCVVE